MPFITQGKTNWKFLLLVIILAVIVGGEALWYSVKEKTPSPQFSEIKKPYIKITSPNGGETWILGNTYDITWQSSEEGTVIINLLFSSDENVCNNKSGCSCAIGEASTSAEKYSWKIDGTKLIKCDQRLKAGKYKIELKLDKWWTNNYDNKYVDDSDNYFNIIENNETADWKTYRNEEYGFEIKYPKDWFGGPNILSNSPSLLFCPSELADPDPKVVCKLKSNVPHMPDSFAPIYLFVSKKPGGTFTLDDLSMKECEKTENITVNNIFVKTSQCGDRGQEAIWYGPGNAYIFRLFLKDNSFPSIFNQMLSTFKFEQSLNPSNPPEEMQTCEESSDCVMAGAEFIGEDSNYGNYACNCINNIYNNRFQECGFRYTCSCSNYCECIDNKCTLKIRENSLF